MTEYYTILIFEGQYKIEQEVLIGEWDDTIEWKSEMKEND